MKRYGIISDTHGYVHPHLFQIFQGVEAILHGGDVGDESVLDELETIAPVYAAQGNVDLSSPRLRQMRVETFDFGVAVITHSHLLADSLRKPSAMAKHLKAHNPRLIVYGHTHIQYCARHDGIWVVNPGPASRPRLHDMQSVVLMTWDEEKDAFSFDLRPLAAV